MNLLIGIDPGVNGGLAYSFNGEIHATKMPSTERDIYNWFLDLPGEGAVAAYAVIEQQTPRPTTIFDHKTKQFRKTILASTCVLYGSFMFLKGCLVASGTRYEECPPKRWQEEVRMHKEPKEDDRKWKNRLKGRAQAMYPNVPVSLYTADALLILESCIRKYGGRDAASTV